MIIEIGKLPVLRGLMKFDFCALKNGAKADNSSGGSQEWI